MATRTAVLLSTAFALVWFISTAMATHLPALLQASGATLAAIAQKLPEIPAGSTVLGFNYDTGERYLSVEGYLPA
jgi:cysteine synthase